MSEIKNIPQILKTAMASEHTSYASTKQFLRQLPIKGKYVIQGPGENAGIVDVGRGFAVALRIESHNHPSYINPYQGAATGVGGILRDIFTMGARPVGILDFLRFGTNKKSSQLLGQVVKGIADYGNCVGVPTIGGDVYFDKTYDHNCLVNVAAIGLVKKRNVIYGNALTPDSDLIYVGARTGRDGIGGAEMASKNLERLDSSAVQDADPFLEKLLLEACCELAETDWIEGMQDMGAAGLLCSTSEVVIRGRKKTGKNLGAKVFLNRVPAKAAKMRPEEFLLSESQERMLIVGKREHRDKILKLFKHWDLEACVIGTVTGNGEYTIVFAENGSKNTKLSIKLEDIFEGKDQNWPHKTWKRQNSAMKKAPLNLTKSIWHQYDWTVGVRTLKGPDKPGHYAILDIPEVKKELVISWSSDEGISNVSPSKGITHAFNNCFKRMQELKAKPLGLTNCLNFGHPKDSLGAFVETIKTLSKLCRTYKVPVVSGNVSLYNAYKNHSIKPTPIIVMVGTRSRPNNKMP